MGSLFSSSDNYGMDNLTPSPSPPAVWVPPSPTPVVMTTATTEPTPSAEESAQKAAEDAAAKRNRGIAGTVLTSWRGFGGTDSAAPTLDLNTLAPTRKRLLGE
ncbi:hypothetical protein WCLP8_3230009 [uncultured Gammaproteobacteria bacterium]